MSTTFWYMYVYQFQLRCCPKCKPKKVSQATRKWIGTDWNDIFVCSVVIFASLTTIKIIHVLNRTLKNILSHSKEYVRTNKFLVCTCIFSNNQRSCGKVMFSVVSVCLPVHKKEWDIVWPLPMMHRTLLYRDPCPPGMGPYCITTPCSSVDIWWLPTHPTGTLSFMVINKPGWNLWTDITDQRATQKNLTLWPFVEHQYKEGHLCFHSS